MLKQMVHSREIIAMPVKKNSKYSPSYAVVHPQLALHVMLSEAPQ